MGINTSLLSYAIHGHKIGDIFYPAIPYTPFPLHHKPVAPGNLITEIKAIQKRFYIRKVEDEGLYWWVDAAFLPYDDSKLVVTMAAYHIENFQLLYHNVTGIPNGRIFLVDLSKNPPDYYVLKGTSCSTQPSLSLHPSSEFIGHIGTAELNLVALDGTKVYSKQKDISNAAFKSCALSPDGVRIAYLTRQSANYEIHVSELYLSPSHLNSKSVRCFKICRQSISNYNTESVKIIWSPDSRYIAVGHVLGSMVILNVKSMRNVCTVPDILVKYNDNGYVTGFDFDSQYEHSVLVVASCDFGTDTVKVHIINFMSNEVLSTFAPSNRTEDTIDCIKFSPDGLSIGVGFQSLTILILSVQNEIIGSILMSIDITPSFRTHFTSDRRDRKIISLQYSTDGQKLITSCADGFVRIFNVGGQAQSLMALCRLKILSLLNVCSVKDLPLPDKIKNYLLRAPVTFE